MEPVGYSICSLDFWRQYVITMRPYLLFISGVAGLVGLAFIEEPDVLRILIAFIPLFLSYGFGQALTDCFQIDTDAISSPYRPLVRGTISRRHVLIVSLLGLAIGVILLGYLNPLTIVFGSAASIGLLTYTVLKRTWWGGPPWNSWIVAMLPIIGRLSDREYNICSFHNILDLRARLFFFAVLAIFFGYANFVVMGYFKDMSADKKTGYRTFPVKFGWLAAAVYSDLLAACVAILTGLTLFLFGNFSVFGIVIYVVAVVINLYAQIEIHRTRDEQRTYRPITNIVRVFILYSAAIIVAHKPTWLLFLIVYYVLFELTLKMRPEETQV